FRELVARRALALGEFVFVVGKLQIEAAAVDVERVAQERAAHGAALDVPAGAAFAPGALELHFGRLARLGALPEREVAGIPLAVAHLDARARFQLLWIAVAELAVITI